MRASNQLQLDLRRDKNGQRRGGSRPRAGRKPKGLRPGSRHKTRDEIDPRSPQHVTLRVVKGIGGMRRRDAYRAIRVALRRGIANHVEFRIVHLSVQGTHVHLLCEAGNKETLARGLQGFQISAAKHMNVAVTRRWGVVRRGQVFGDRYHVESISSIRQVRNTLAYVINNWRRHREDRSGGLLGGRIDPFSSGLQFAGWREPLPAIALPTDYEPPAVSRPQTWMLAEGWKRGRPISVFEVPGPRD